MVETLLFDENVKLYEYSAISFRYSKTMFLYKVGSCRSRPRIRLRGGPPIWPPPRPHGSVRGDGGGGGGGVRDGGGDGGEEEDKGEEKEVPRRRVGAHGQIEPKLKRNSTVQKLRLTSLLPTRS